MSVICKRDTKKALNTIALLYIKFTIQTYTILSPVEFKAWDEKFGF